QIPQRSPERSTASETLGAFAGAMALASCFWCHRRSIARIQLKPCAPPPNSRASQCWCPIVLERCRVLRSPTDSISTLTGPYSSRTGLQPHFSASLRQGNRLLLAQLILHWLSERFGKITHETPSGAVNAIQAIAGRTM